MPWILFYLTRENMVQNLSKPLLLFVLLSNYLSDAYTQNFGKVFGTDTEEKISGLFQADSGDFFVYGSQFNKDSSFTHGFIAKHDSFGQLGKVQLFGSQLYELSISHIVPANSGYFLICRAILKSNPNGTDFAIIQTDSAGNVLQSRIYDHPINGANFNAFQGHINAAGDLFILAGSNYLINLFTIDTSNLQIKTQANYNGGSYTRAFRTINYDHVRDTIYVSIMSVQPNGDTYLGLAALNSGLQVIWDNTWELPGSFLGINGNPKLKVTNQKIHLAFQADGLSGGDLDAVFAQFNTPDGSLNWARSYGGQGYEALQDFIPYQNGWRLTILSNTIDSIGNKNDLILLDVDTQGLPLAQHYLNAVETESNAFIAPDGYVLTETNSYGLGENDYALMALDSAFSLCKWKNANLPYDSMVNMQSTSVNWINQSFAVNAQNMQAFSFTGSLDSLSSICADCPAVSASFDYIQNNRYVHLVNTSQNASSYRWESSQDTFSIENPVIYYPDSISRDTILLIATSNCGTDTLRKAVDFNSDTICTLNIKPGKSLGKDVEILSYPLNQNKSNASSLVMRALRWTAGGVPFTSRILIDFENIPNCDTSTLQSAKLYLYNPPNSLPQAAANRFRLHPIQSSWNEHYVNWNSQPAFVNSVYTNLKGFNAQGHLDNFDFTSTFKYERTHGQHGFMLKLINESNLYYSATFASSEFNDASLRPELQIDYREFVSLPNLPDTVWICQGDSVQLTGSVAYKHLWWPNYNLSCDTCDSTNIWPAKDTTYHLYQYACNNCAQAYRTVVKVLPKPTANAVPSFCAGESASLSIDSPQSYTHTWHPLELFEDSLGSQASTKPISDSTWVWVESRTGSCLFIDSLFLAPTKPQVKDTFATICLYDSIWFRGEYLHKGGLYSYDDSSGCGTTTLLHLSVESDTIEVQSSICQSEPLAYKGETFHQPGIYYIKGEPDSCGQVVQLMLNYIEPDTGKYTTVICQGDSLLWHDQWVDSSGAFSYQSCDSVLFLTVEQKLCTKPQIDSLFFPNVITPNNDGKNDYWELGTLEAYPPIEVHIINRWGNLVYSSDAYNNGWNGAGLPAGTYFYRAYSEELKLSRKGYIEVIR